MLVVVLSIKSCSYPSLTGVLLMTTLVFQPQTHLGTPLQTRGSMLLYLEISQTPPLPHPSPPHHHHHSLPPQTRRVWKWHHSLFHPQLRYCTTGPRLSSRSSRSSLSTPLWIHYKFYAKNFLDHSLKCIMLLLSSHWPCHSGRGCCGPSNWVFLHRATTLEGVITSPRGSTFLF